jgi:GT2 family glycosyltransferase
MPDDPRVAVIVLNYNGWHDTVECLRSLEKMDYPNYWTIVVDNGSADDSVARISEHFPEIPLIETGRNLGEPRGNNVGIRRALDEGAEYVWVLNNDTVADPGSLGAMVRTAEAAPAVGAVGSVLFYMSEPEQVQAWGGGRVLMWWGTARYLKGPVPEESLHYITGGCILLRSQALWDVGLLDERFFLYWVDAELSFRLRKAGWSLAVAEGSHVWHKEFAGSTWKEFAKGQSALTDRHWNTSAVLFFREYAPLPPLPIVIGVGGRIVKRLARRDWKSAESVARGALGGLNV